MTLPLIIVGLIELLFGFLVAVAGIFLASRLLARLVRAGQPDAALGQGNVAVGVLKGSGFLALGLLASDAVKSGFAAFDYLAATDGATWGTVGAVAGYALLHVAVALTLGALLLAAGALLFDRMTGGVDEMDQIRTGNVAPAVVLGAVLVVLALLTAPGLRSILQGLLPLPELPSGVIEASS